MANLSVSLLIRYKDSGGKWHRSPAARGKNGRVRPGYAQVGAGQVQVQPYTYDLRIHKGRVSGYVSVGQNAADADAERARREKLASAVAVAADAGLRVDADPERETFRAARGRYISDAEARGATEAVLQARQVLDEFALVSRRNYIDEVTREDVLRFHEALRKRGCAPRTVANKHNRLKSFLLFSGMDSKTIPPMPRYDKELPTVYSAEQIDAIKKAAAPTMRSVILLALQCGLREQEIIHLEWRDLDMKAGVLRVRSKAEWKFQVKDAEERDIPIPTGLLEELKAERQENPKARMVVSGKQDKPEHHLLRSLKRLARAAKLNCGTCDGCKAPHEECREWTLHKFRRTYCTSLLRSGIDLRTVQAFMGHADMESTMRYLRPAAGKEVREKLNAVKFG
jgi:integrase